MNRPFVARALGLVLLCEAASMLPSLGIAVYFQENDYLAFISAIIIITIIAIPLVRLQVISTDAGYREGFIIAAFSWLLLALFGTIPFMVSGALPNFFDAFFETMSGFTTTGASVIEDVEAIPKSIIFWRSTTQWLGGMGIIVLTLAMIPSFKIAGLKLYRAEVPGLDKTKVLPRVAQSSRELYKLYLIITAAEIIALKLVGLSWFDSFIYSFSSVATGGFTNHNTGASLFNNHPGAEYIILFFMFIYGLSFTMHYHALRGNFKPLWKDPESRVYLGIAIFAWLLISANLISAMDYSTGAALKESLFQSVSILTTSGFIIADYTQWPSFSQGVLFLLMFVGGCAGSTAGGIKVVRYIILAKSASVQIAKLIHPKAVIPVRLGRNPIPTELVDNVYAFFFLYFAMLFICTLLLTAMGLELFDSFAAVAASLGNIGPGFGLTGPASNYSSIPDLGKILLNMCMLLGRLEIYTILVFFSRQMWKS